VWAPGSARVSWARILGDIEHLRFFALFWPLPWLILMAWLVDMPCKHGQVANGYGQACNWSSVAHASLGLSVECLASHGELALSRFTFSLNQGWGFGKFSLASTSLLKFQAFGKLESKSCATSPPSGLTCEDTTRPW
jgi:hypothetical protein